MGNYKIGDRVHKYHGIVTHSELSPFPIGTWVTLEADGVEVTLPSGVSVIRGATSHAILNTELGEGMILNRKFTYGVARSALGQAQLVGHMVKDQDAEILLALDTSGYYKNRLRLAGGDLQVRGADADRIRDALVAGDSDALTESTLQEFFELYGQEDKDPDRFDLTHTSYRKLKGWRRCRMSS